MRLIMIVIGILTQQHDLDLLIWRQAQCGEDLFSRGKDGMLLALLQHKVIELLEIRLFEFVCEQFLPIFRESRLDHIHSSLFPYCLIFSGNTTWIAILYYS